MQVTPDATGATSITATVAGCGGTAKLNVTAATPFQITSIQVTPSFIQVNPIEANWPVASGQVLDQYGNPVVGANITVSGGYGSQAAGTTNANGVFDISVDPTNVGGPFYVTVSASDSLGSINATSGTGLTVVQYPPATMTIALVNPGMSIYSGQLIPVFCTLYNQNMQLWNSATVEFVTVTDANAQLSNLTPSGPTGSGTGSLQQTTGTYANGESAANVNFDQSGSQTVLAELYINGNFTGTCAALTMTVLPGAVSQIAWNPVQPGTTVTAGSTMTVSGVALNSLGQPVPNGTQVIVEMPGSNAQNQTVYTSTHSGQQGWFTAALVPITYGSYEVEAFANNQTFIYGNPTPVIVKAGAPSYGDMTDWAPVDTLPPGFGLSIATLFCDSYGNAIYNQEETIKLLSQPAGAGLPTSYSGTSDPSDGWMNWGVGALNVQGTYVFQGVLDGITSSTITITISSSASQVYYISGSTGSVTPLHISVNGGANQNASSSPITVTAGNTITVSGYLLNQSYQGVSYSLCYGLRGFGQYGTGSNSSGYFSFSVTAMLAGNNTSVAASNQMIAIWNTWEASWWNQLLTVKPGPTTNLQVILNPSVSNFSCMPGDAAAAAPIQNITILATDQYGNPENGITVTVSTPVSNVGLPETVSITNGVAYVYNFNPPGGATNAIEIETPGTIPITVATSDGKSTTVYFTT